MKIYDCFQFFNELDLLEIRLELLYDHVDYFVISETNRTHSNKNKKLFFAENKELFSKYMDKIIHVTENLPEEIFSFQKKEETTNYNNQYNKIIDIFISEDENGLKEFPTFARDYMQREFIKLGLINCDDDDIIMVSDLDEIPHPQIIKKIKKEKLYNHCVMMDCHNFYVNNICHTNWYGTYSVSYDETKNNALTHLRNRRVSFNKIYSAGWHLSFIGGPERIKTKIESYSHQEYNNEYFLNSVEKKITENSDLFGRTNSTYGDSIQKYYFDEMKNFDIEEYNYPNNMINLIKNKFPYLIKPTNKMKKIVITGGLGYVGTELCNLYSGEARYKNIVVIDSRFVSERVKQLRDWGIDFIHGSIMDENLMRNVLHDADVVFHLAGITDVAYTKTESNTEKDFEITRIGVDGTRNIIKYTNKDCKIIFPSTHVVYEGLGETKFQIDESYPVAPVLTYSKGKVESESDLIKSDKNFIILRFASVYGYSTDTMRINIMPNLFSKITSQNGTINLFSGGIQHKSLVSLIDTVRALKFMAESDFSREIFHLSNESMTIKEVAEICKKINPKVTLVETNDEIPNLGYTISNQKLLSTGFQFRYNIETCIEEMITKWSKKPLVENLEYIIRGGKDFIDERGKITNYELTEPINLIGYIESKAGTVRANHYHPIQEQKCLLIKGKYVSVIKDLSYTNAPLETRIINSGDIAVIRPNVAHTMVFLEDSIFLNLVRGEREHENYGITHTIPFTLVDEDFKKNIIKNYSSKCRSCGSKNLEDVISLGLSPLANNLLDTNDEKTEMFPLEMKYCPLCHNCQLSYVVEPEKMFDNYLYTSSTAESFRNHFIDAANSYIKKYELNSNTLVVDIGSNDGIFLKPLKENGIKTLGVEPAKNISELANKNGIETINSYFDKQTVDYIIETYGNATLVTASNVFAHSDDLVNITNEVFRLLKNDGSFIIEVQYLLDTIKDLTFDNIYHEHVNYWSVTSLNNFFKRLGYHIYKVEHINTHGGSIRVYVKRNGENIDTSVNYYLKEEQDLGMTDINTYKEFKKKIEKIKLNVRKNLKNLKKQYNKVSAYGSPAKATTSLNYFGIDNYYIDYTIEDNLLKNNKIIPGVGIPIKDKKYCNENLPNVVVVLAWNFFNDIVKNNQDLVEKGVKFINIKDLQNEDFIL